MGDAIPRPKSRDRNLTRPKLSRLRSLGTLVHRFWRQEAHKGRVMSPIHGPKSTSIRFLGCRNKQQPLTDCSLLVSPYFPLQTRPKVEKTKIQVSRRMKGFIWWQTLSTWFVRCAFTRLTGSNLSSITWRMNTAKTGWRHAPSARTQKSRT